MEKTILVFSDSHGNASLMKQALDAFTYTQMEELRIES